MYFPMLLSTRKRRDADTSGTTDKLKLPYFSLSCLPAECQVAGLLLLDHAHNLADIICSDCHAGD